MTGRYFIKYIQDNHYEDYELIADVDAQTNEVILMFKPKERTKEKKIQFDYLNKINWSEYLYEQATLRDVMDDMELTRNYLPEPPEELKENLFKYCTQEELADYLEASKKCTIYKDYCVDKVLL